MGYEQLKTGSVIVKQRKRQFFKVNIMGSAAQVIEDVLVLHKIAAARRRERFQNGALRLDNVKLNFTLDADGNPCDAHPHGA